MNKKSALIYEEFYLGVQALPEDMQLEAYNAYCRLVLYGEEYEGDNIAVKVLLASLHGKVDQANRNYQKKVEAMQKVNEAKKKRSRTTSNDNARQRTTSNDNARCGSVIDIDIVNDIDNPLKGVNKAHPYNADTLKKQFGSQELADEFGIWLDCRFADPAPYPPAAMADDLSKAKKYEHEYGAQAVIDILKASLSYKRPVWDRLNKGKPKEGKEDGFDYLTRRIREEEEKEAAQNDKNRIA